MGEINAECRSLTLHCKNRFSSRDKQKWASKNREILPDRHEFLKTILGYLTAPVPEKTHVIDFSNSSPNNHKMCMKITCQKNLRFL